MENLAVANGSESKLKLPTAPGFSQFLAEMQALAPDVKYVWSKEKELSCDWIIERIDGGKGVDIGGTPYLYNKLREKGCDMTIYDQFLEPDFEQGIADDMINVLDHFDQESLDFITTRHTLEHAISPMFQLWAYNRILKTGGKLFVIVPNHSKEWVWFPTHNNCLPYDNWAMLFYRMGFNIKTADAGTWKRADPKFIEWRFELVKASNTLRF